MTGSRVRAARPNAPAVNGTRRTRRHAERAYRPVANAIDQLIELVAPRAAARRAEARWRLHEVARLSERLSIASYQGATGGRRTQGWVARGGSAETTTRLSLAALRARARDLTRNNPWARKAVQVLTTNTVGRGILGEAVVSERGQLGETLSRSQQRQLRDEVDREWQEWAGTTDCDADGRHTFAGLQSLVQRSCVESGELLIRYRRRRIDSGLRVPLQIQLLEGDHLDTTRDLVGAPNGRNRIRQGIEFDPIGRRVAYWLFPEHPGDGFHARTLTSERVPASEIEHVFRVDRIGQIRGVPSSAAALLTLRDFEDYLDAQRLRMKIGNLWGGFIRDLSTDLPDAPQTADPDEQAVETLEPGMLERLPPGKTIEFPDPPRTESHETFHAISLRAIAACFGITYEALTGDLSSVSFTSGRMGRLEQNRETDDWVWRVIVPQFCAPVWRRWAAIAWVAGRIDQPVASRWTPPKRELLDPGREVGALIRQVRAGFLSLSEAIRMLGGNRDQVFERLAEDLEEAERLGLSLTTLAGGDEDEGAIASDPG